MDQINECLISIKVQTKISKYFGIMSRELCFLKLQRDEECQYHLNFITR